MAGRGRTWYSEQGTEERPSSIPGMVELYRAGKFISLVPAQAAETESAAHPTNAEQDAMQRGGNFMVES
jgi:hypothetical protein